MQASGRPWEVKTNAPTEGGAGRLGAEASPILASETHRHLLFCDLRTAHLFPAPLVSFTVRCADMGGRTATEPSVNQSLPACVTLGRFPVTW